MIPGSGSIPAPVILKASNVSVRTLTKNALRGCAPENAHTVRRRILRMLGFEPGQIVCPGSFCSR